MKESTNILPEDLNKRKSLESDLKDPNTQIKEGEVENLAPKNAKKGVTFGDEKIIIFSSSESPDQVKQDMIDLKEITQTLKDGNQSIPFIIKKGVNGKPIIYLENLTDFDNDTVKNEIIKLGFNPNEATIVIKNPANQNKDLQNILEKENANPDSNYSSNKLDNEFIKAYIVKASALKKYSEELNKSEQESHSKNFISKITSFFVPSNSPQPTYGLSLNNQTTSRYK